MTGLDDRLMEKIDLLSEEEKIELLLQLEDYEAENNRRAHPRLPFFAEVTYADDRNQATQEFVRDLSEGGMFIETSEPLEVGQSLQAHFSLPGVKEDIRVPAKVVRITNDGMGVRFKRPPSRRLRRFFPSFALWSRRLPISAYIKTALKERLSDSAFQKLKESRQRVQYMLQPLNRMRHRGNHYYCPICESFIKRFQPRLDTESRRPGARCPVCQSLERHRLDYLFLQKMTTLFDSQPKRLLHVAPEPMFEKVFHQIDSIESVTVDLKERAADVVADITNLPFPADSFDVIYCSHVLEHVPDDCLALAELYRVMRPSGWGLIEVPITSRKTFEDNTITNSFLRTKLFGQRDHCRRYGLDFQDKLDGAGFDVRMYDADDVLKDRQQLVKYGINEHRKLFYCRKQA